MVGDDSRVAELSSAAVLRREEGRRWRTSVFNLLRSALGLLLLLGSSSCARRVWPRYGARRAGRARTAGTRGKDGRDPGAAAGRLFSVKSRVAVPWRRIARAEKSFAGVASRARVLVRFPAGMQRSAAEVEYTSFCIRVITCRFHASTGCVACREESMMCGLLLSTIVCVPWILPVGCYPLSETGQRIRGRRNSESDARRPDGFYSQRHVITVIWMAFLCVHKKVFGYET
jgi:hypothetical protein